MSVVLCCWVPTALELSLIVAQAESPSLLLQLHLCWHSTLLLRHAGHIITVITAQQHSNVSL